MNTKTTGLAVVVILVLAITFIVYLIINTNKATEDAGVVNLPEVNQNQAKDSQGENQAQSNEPAYTTPYPAEIKGKVVSIKNTHWLIDQPTGVVEVGIDAETPVYKGEVSEENKATVFDVSAGTMIEAKLDEGAGDVLEAVIVE